MDEDYLKRIITTIILVSLLVLTFYMMRPLLMSIIIALILGFIFNPLYNWVHKKIKSPNLAAGIMCIILFLVIAIPFWMLTPIFVDQSIKFYFAAQQADLVTPLKNIFPKIFASDQFSSEVASIISNFISNTTTSFVNSISKLILNFPKLFLQFLVVFFTFFFVLRDRDELLDYIKSLLPFSKEIENKIFKYSREITMSVIYGQVIIGIIQGLIVGIAFFMFRIPNALFLTFLASLAGIFPIIGTTIVWLPVMIYSIIAGNTFAAIGILFFGLISSTFDNFFRPLFVSKMTKMHSALILIGMIGGLFIFGVMGFILGPLILAYLLIIIEIYRNKRTPGIFIRGPVTCKS